MFLGFAFVFGFVFGFVLGFVLGFVHLAGERVMVAGVELMEDDVARLATLEGDELREVCVCECVCVCVCV